jgi:lipopolysaccharide/colanic/teichoic acid biosynthesis glycosyltransferase
MNETCSAPGLAIRLGAGGFPLWKRVLDVMVCTLLLVCALPLLLVVAAAIRFSGPAIFWQRRVGQHGREFWFPKLRSMYAGADALHHAMRDHNDHGDSVTFKMKADPRITRIGRLIRMLSIDELPQLWCVLNGDMSLVGPRPPLPSEVEKYTPTQRRRLEVRPGLTGLWQVCGRSMIPFDGQVALDLEYIERQNILLDLGILARTIPAVLSAKGAW